MLASVSLKIPGLAAVPSPVFGTSPKSEYLYLIASGASFLISNTLNLFSSST